MAKRAVIYIRTSSEQQAEKNSPAEQESDCRQFALENGLVVVNVYRDIERYRSKNKWVEPSGTRYDRPGLMAMLRDAADGQFDVILAWREDRLYRGMRAMLLVLETVQQYNISIMLARETFDVATAPLKAWLAQVELEHIKERMTMGVKARLRAGKANSGQDRYGYQRRGDVIEIVPEEAEWVRAIFQWHVEGVSDREIRRRLIHANAPQKQTTMPRKIQWSLHSIKSIISSGEAYASGIKIQRREGDEFFIEAKPILDAETYEKYLAIKQQFTPSSRKFSRDDFLTRGLLYCPCGYKMQARIPTHIRANYKEGQRVSGYYQCACRHDELISKDCPRTVKNRVADAEVWNQVYHVITQPELLIEQARILVTELENTVSVQSANKEKFEHELDVLLNDRQWVITQARKGGMTEDEMDQRLNDMSVQEVALRQALAATSEVLPATKLENWEEHLAEYLADIQEGLRALNTTPASRQEEIEINHLKRRAIETLVEKVTVDRERRLTVTIRVNLLQILDPSLGNGGSNSGQASGSGTPGKSSAPQSRGGAQFKTSRGYVRVRAIAQI